MSHSHVLLLRAPSDNISKQSTTANGGDPYEALLKPSTSLPVYETRQTLDELQWIMETGPAFHGYKGVIVTSKRAVDAWAAAAHSVPAPADERAHWTDVPFYVVGIATATAVQDLSSRLSDSSHLAPRQVLGGDECGTGEQLAHFILKRLAEQRDAESAAFLSPDRSTNSGSGPASFSSASVTLAGSISTDNLSLSASGGGSVQGHDKSQQRRARVLRRPTKLLFLVGDKTRDALPSILSADDHIELDSVQVYSTQPSASFPSALRTAVLAQPKVKDWWIAIFAPSGADYALPHLREHFTLPSLASSPITPITPTSSSPLDPNPTSTSISTSNSSSNSNSGFAALSKKKSTFKKHKSPPSARIAAIGPTTAAHLRDVLKLDVTAVATKPNPEALMAAIKGAGNAK